MIGEVENNMDEIRIGMKVLKEIKIKQNRKAK